MIDLANCQARSCACYRAVPQDRDYTHYISKAQVPAKSFLLARTLNNAKALDLLRALASADTLDTAKFLHPPRAFTLFKTLDTARSLVPPRALISTKTLDIAPALATPTRCSRHYSDLNTAAPK